LASYELTYILRPLEEANLTAANDRVTTIVQNASGEIVGRHDWGRRRLAYPIRKIPDGYYTTLYINLPGNAVRGVERSLQLTDDVLRYLVVRVEEHKLPAAPAEAPAPAMTAQPEAQPTAEMAAPESEAAAPAVANAGTETSAEGS
jgi:small subunit ribosomal protein S6